MQSLIIIFQLVKPNPNSKIIFVNFETFYESKILTIIYFISQVMESNPGLTIKDKLAMIETCIIRYPVRQDTDSEYWNPRFLPTPESQKQETLIDDRWATRKRKS